MGYQKSDGTPRKFLNCKNLTAWLGSLHFTRKWNNEIVRQFRKNV